MADILLAEDERIVRAQYVALFESEGYSVRAVRDGAAALEAFEEKRPDIVVLDLDMPKLSGYRVCERIREVDALVPVLILTAGDTDANEVRALQLGADTFCSKMDSPSVLLSRIRRALERSEKVSSISSEGRGGLPAILKLGKVSVDTDTLVVTDSADYADRLTRGEIDALASLYDAGGRSLSTEEILDAMRMRGSPCDIAMLYQHISNLRKKLGPAGELIVHQRRVGYRLLK